MSKMSFFGALPEYGVFQSVDCFGDCVFKGAVTHEAPVFERVLATSISLDADTTYTASQVIGGRIERDPAGADRTDSLPDAEALLLEMPNAVVGSSFSVVIANTGQNDRLVSVTPGAHTTGEVVSLKKNESATLRMIVTQLSPSRQLRYVVDSDVRENALSIFEIYEESDLPAVDGSGFHPLRDNSVYRFNGLVSLASGLDFGDSCAVVGASGTSGLSVANGTTAFRASAKNVRVSNMRVIGGGDNSVGLFDLSDIDYNVNPAVSPAMGRSKTCEVDANVFLGTVRFGRIDGFSTVRVVGNIVNGQGLTESGFEFSNSQSMEFLNNKVGFFLGLSGPSTAAMLHMVSNDAWSSGFPYSGPGFSAVLVTGNILHPRNAEKAILFDEGSTTVLGNISANTFIYVSPAVAVDYERRTVYDNLNPLSVQNYQLGANNGVPPALPWVNCFANGSPAATIPIGVAGSLKYIDEFLPTSSIAAFGNSKIAVLLKTETPAVAFQKNEIVTGATSGGAMLVMEVVSPTEYWVVDLTASLANTEALSGSKGGSATISAGSSGLYFRFKYVNKVPARMIFTLKLSAGTIANNMEIESTFEIERNATANMSENTAIAFSPRNNSGVSVIAIESSVALYGDSIRFLVTNRTGVFDVLIYNASFVAVASG